MKLKCQSCSERATHHITEVEGDGFAEHHFCYKCAQKYLHETEESAEPEETPAAAPAKSSTAPAGRKASCPPCKITFEEFRSTGRLGCPHDYEVFREELRPLLDNIHGSLRHVGKVPRRLPADTRRQTQLIQLRQELQQMIAIEDYERAARIRDQIEALDKEA